MWRSGNKTSDITTASRLLLFAFAILFTLSITIFSQRVAVIAPERTQAADIFAESLSGMISQYAQVIDRSAAEAAFSAMGLETPFNLTTDQTRNAGSAIGCDAIILVKADVQRRGAFGEKTYWEASPAVFILGSRTGMLLDFHHRDVQGRDEKEALSKLAADADAFANLLAADLRRMAEEEIKRAAAEKIEDHSRNTEDDAGLRPPMPYQRITPEYTPLAELYAIRATVDAEVDIDSAGNVQRVAIVRWAGYGLDTSVTIAIRKMNWRPAERSGKTLPMRVLLRYNFTKIEKDEN